MIEVIEGKGVGAGKSYFVLERLMEQWRRGGTAYVSQSFRVKWAECKEYAKRRYGLLLEDDQWHEVEPDKIAKLHEHTPPGTPECPLLIVIDEAQDQLNARDWNDSSKRNLFQWCCQSRHDDNDLFFVSQSAANVDKQIRRLATFTWSVRNANNFSIPGLGNVARNIRLLTFGLNNGFYFIRTMLDYDGRTVLEKKWVKADARLFACYESKSMRLARRRSGEAVGKKTLKYVKGRTPMMKWAVMGGMCVALVAGYNLVKGGIWGKTNVPLHSPASHAATATSQKLAETGRAAYELKHEPWLSQGRGWMRLTSGMYRVGKLCGFGMVEAIQDDTVRVRKPDGGTLYIVGEDWHVPVVPVPEQAPWSAKEIIIAKDSGIFPAASDPFIKPAGSPAMVVVNTPAPVIEKMQKHER